MSEPDEALLWARERALKYTNPALHNEIREGLLDHDFGITVLATGYRAGAAASEARIKALEEALRDIAEGDVCVCDLRDARDRTLQSIALAALKEADQ